MMISISSMCSDEILRARMQWLRREQANKKKILRESYKPTLHEKKTIFYLEYFDQNNKLNRTGYNLLPLEVKYIDLLLNELSAVKGWDE